MDIMGLALGSRRAGQVSNNVNQSGSIVWLEKSFELNQAFAENSIKKREKITQEERRKRKNIIRVFPVIHNLNFLSIF